MRISRFAAIRCADSPRHRLLVGLEEEYLEPRTGYLLDLALPSLAFRDRGVGCPSRFLLPDKRGGRAQTQHARTLLKSGASSSGG